MSMFSAQKTYSDPHETIVPDHSLVNTSPEKLAELFKDSFIQHPDNSAYHIKLMQDGLYYLHDVQGIPWWMTIALFTWTFRTLFLPLNISLVRNSAKLNSIRKDLQPMMQQMADQSATEEEKTQTAQKALEIFKQNKCSPFRNILPPILMTPVFLSVFTAWERIILFTPSCADGGALWFTNLAASDVSYLLPVVSAITWIWTFRLGSDRARSEGATYLERFCSYLSLAMIPVTQVLPQGVFLYWISSNTYSLVLMYLTRLPRVRKLLNIPPAQGKKREFEEY